MSTYSRHYEESAVIKASPEKVFALMDDHNRMGSHMSGSSWMMGGGKVNFTMDEGRGQRLGSHIKFDGKAFGFTLYVDEVITKYEPPLAKSWETVGDVKLVVIGEYLMGFDIKPQGQDSILRVFIDYNMPKKNVWLGKLMGNFYSKWCVRQMLKSAKD